MVIGVVDGDGPELIAEDVVERSGWEEASAGERRVGRLLEGLPSIRQLAPLALSSDFPHCLEPSRQPEALSDHAENDGGGVVHALDVGLHDEEDGEFVVRGE